MRNFVLSEAKAGKPVVTSNGMPARIICFDHRGVYPLVALIGEGKIEEILTFTEGGRYHLEGGSGYDLMMKDDDDIECNAKPVRWIDKERRKVSGFYINTYSEIKESKEIDCTLENRNVFATKRQAQSALALAQLTQIIANDPRFGGPITNDEWANNVCVKYVIRRCDLNLIFALKVYTTLSLFSLLAFHTEEQALLFRKENESLLKKYFMI